MVAKPHVYKRSDSPFFLLSYYDEEGNRVRRSSGQTSRKAAEKELTRILDQMVETPSGSLSLSEGLDLFLDGQPLKPTSYRRYQVSLANWFDFFRDHDLVIFKQVTRKVIRKFMDTRKSSGVSDPTVLRDMAFLSSAWNYLLNHPDWEEKMPSNPIDSRLKQSLKESLPRYRMASPDEWKRIMAATTNDMQRCVLTIAVETGMRESELAHLEWRMVDLANRQIILTPDVVSLKNNRPRIIPLSQAACDKFFVTPRHPKAKTVFWHGDGQPFDRFSNSWRGIRRRSGVSNFRFHDIRHTFAGRFLNNTGDLMALKSILGHTSVAVTERYAYLIPGTLHERMRSFDRKNMMSIENE